MARAHHGMTILISVFAWTVISSGFILFWRFHGGNIFACFTDFINSSTEHT